jgi:hypothetical protein
MSTIQDSTSTARCRWPVLLPCCQDLRLHLDGSLEVAVHTTGYVQSSWYNRCGGCSRLCDKASPCRCLGQHHTSVVSRLPAKWELTASLSTHYRQP